MAKKTLQTNLLMLLVAMIWGSALVAQRMGMDSTGPLLFSGLRFAMGALVILPFLLYRRHAGIVQLPFFAPRLLAGGMLLGVLVTAGINLQQTGLLLTSVSHAGFITGMYVLMVPLLGLLIGHHPAAGTWLGALLALAGLYLLSVEDGLRIASGDWLQLAGAFCWALHVLLMGHLAKKHDPLRLALIQFVTCAVISLLAALQLVRNSRRRTGTPLCGRAFGRSGFQLAGDCPAACPACPCSHHPVDGGRVRCRGGCPVAG